MTPHPQISLNLRQDRARPSTSLTIPRPRPLPHEPPRVPRHYDAIVRQHEDHQTVRSEVAVHHPSRVMPWLQCRSAATAAAGRRRAGRTAP
eukprot:504001-Prorocentrum_minimum.AAC.1